MTGGANSLELLWALLALAAIACVAAVTGIAWIAVWVEARLAGTGWSVPLTHMPGLLVELATGSRPAALAQAVAKPWRPLTIAALLSLGLTAAALHNEQAKVLEAIEPLVVADCGVTTVRAQYERGTLDGVTVRGYRDEPNVSPHSTTETYAAFKLSIDNWRWAGVPFYLRTGKRLRRKHSEVMIEFKQPPLALFRQAAMTPPQPNQLVIAIQPDETITLRLSAKVPGPEVTASPVDMRFNYEDYFGLEQQTGYETLLYDAMTGDRNLFKRADMIELAWTVVDQILQGWGMGGCALAQYPAGSAGPVEADAMLARDGRAWRAL